MRALAFRGQRPPAQQGTRQAVQVVRRREVRGEDRRLRDRPKEELIRRGDPGCGQDCRHSDGKHQHRASRPCDAVTTGRGRCQSARAHRGQPRLIHGAHPEQRQTEQWRAIIGQGRSPQRPEARREDVVWKRVESLRARYVAWTFSACQTQRTGTSRKASAIFCPHVGGHFSRNWLCFLCFKSESHSRSILKKATST